jgi:hypothetical protein
LEHVGREAQIRGTIADDACAAHLAQLGHVRLGCQHNTQHTKTRRQCHDTQMCATHLHHSTPVLCVPVCQPTAYLRRSHSATSAASSDTTSCETRCGWRSHGHPCTAARRSGSQCTWWKCRPSDAGCSLEHRCNLDLKQLPTSTNTVRLSTPCMQYVVSVWRALHANVMGIHNCDCQHCGRIQLHLHGWLHHGRSARTRG